MKKIPLTQGYFALVDDEDYEWLSAHLWHVNKQPNSNYAITTHDGKQVLMHRLIMELKMGDGIQVDHINHDGLDNQKSNIRICNKQQNQCNRFTTKHSSQYRGVCVFNKNKVFSAQITINQVKHHLGLFRSEKEAAQTYDRVAIKVFGEFAQPNFPRRSYQLKNLLTVEQAKRLRDIRTLRQYASRFTGVVWEKRRNKWKAQIRHDNRLVYLGLFENEIDAARKYNEYVIKNKLNRKLNLE